MAAGARLFQNTNVTEPIIDPRTDRIAGVRSKDGREFRAPMVVAADGNSTRLALAMGLTKRDDRQQLMRSECVLAQRIARQQDMIACLEVRSASTE